MSNNELSYFQGAIIGILCGNAFTIWLFVGSLLKPTEQPSTALPTYNEGCDSNSTLTLDVQSIVRQHRKVEPTFFYIPDGDWEEILYSTSYHLYALSGFLICLIICLFTSLLSRLCMRHYRPVEPLLLHPIVRRKESEIQHGGRNSSQHPHNHPNPYVMSHFQPYYGQRFVEILAHFMRFWLVCDQI